MLLKLSGERRAKALRALLLGLIVSVPCWGQIPTTNWGPRESGSVGIMRATEPSPQHKFWDAQNRVLFSAVVTLNAADFALTHSNLSNGGKELNPVARAFCGSTAGQAANFVGQAAGDIGLSYLFHRTGHHRLERITSMINIGASATAVSYSAAHR